MLNDIHIDIMDYIVPATCPDVQFRSMWAEFEWENKVAVNTAIAEPTDFLQHIIASTNMVRVAGGQGGAVEGVRQLGLGVGLPAGQRRSSPPSWGDRQAHAFLACPPPAPPRRSA